MMKLKLYIIALLASVAVFTSCDNDDDDVKNSNVPQLVQNTFQNKYPGVTARWEREDGMLKAEFVKDGQTVDAWFTTDGTWVRTETDYRGTLPEAVTTYIAAKYPGYTIDTTDIEWIETPSGDYFEIELDHPSKPDVTIRIKTDGTLVTP